MHLDLWVHADCQLNFCIVYCRLDAQLIAIKKEIGDIYYYKTMLLNLLNIDQPITDIAWESEEGLQVEILGDLIKKFV